MTRLESLLGPYAEHPDRFLPRQQLVDNDDERDDIKQLIDRLCALRKVSFHRINGILRRKFKVGGYLGLHFTQIQSAKRLLLSLTSGDLPPRAKNVKAPKPVPSGQQPLFKVIDGGAPKTTKHTKIAG